MVAAAAAAAAVHVRERASIALPLSVEGASTIIHPSTQLVMGGGE
jgi:hypothetical protein